VGLNNFPDPIEQGVGIRIPKEATIILGQSQFSPNRPAANFRKRDTKHFHKGNLQKAKY
jgi:hypothetical protein